MMAMPRFVPSRRRRRRGRRTGSGRRVGAPYGLAQQFLPLRARQAAAVPVGPRVLAPVVEEPDVVVLLLQRPDLPLDELVQLGQVAGEVRGDVEVHIGKLR